MLQLSFSGNNISSIIRSKMTVLIQMFSLQTFILSVYLLKLEGHFHQFTKKILPLKINYLASISHAKFMPLAFLEAELRTSGNINLMETLTASNL